MNLIFIQMVCSLIQIITLVLTRNRYPGSNSMHIGRNFHEQQATFIQYYIPVSYGKAFVTPVMPHNLQIYLQKGVCKTSNGLMQVTFARAYNEKQCDL